MEQWKLITIVAWIAMTTACVKAREEQAQKNPMTPVTEGTANAEEMEAPAEENYVPSHPSLAGDDGFPAMEGLERIDPKSEEFKEIMNEWGMSLTALTIGQKIIRAGKKYIGLPFEFGAKLNQKESFDCSKFMYFAVKEAGYGRLPRTARGQVAYLKKKSSKYVKKNLPHRLSGLRQGDLIYWHLNDDRVRPGIASHSSIYGGKDKKGRHLLLQATQSYGVDLMRLYGSFLDEKKIVDTFRILRKLN